ncbi:MAG: ubiquitin-like domain-containing protein [Chloroflexi bacterium]|nr:ubiquitin-like domain-containing protein [Chloroflexota bacterium]
MSEAPSEPLGDATGRHPEPNGWLTLLQNRVVLIGVAALVFVACTAAFFLTRKTITVVDGSRQMTVETHATTVQSALRGAQMTLDPADLVFPGLQTPLANGLRVTIERARPVYLAADGQDLTIRTQASTVGETLAQAGIALAPEDLVLAHGERLGLDTSLGYLASPVRLASVGAAALARAVPSTRGGRPQAVEGAPASVELTVKRAVPITVHDGGLPVAVNTAADTVGEALRGAGINVYLADVVRPAVETPVTANMHVYIERSKSVTIASDDTDIAPQGSFVTRTRRDSFAQLLADEGIALNGRESFTPALDSVIAHGSMISIRRYRPFQVEVDGGVVAGKTKQATVREALADVKVNLGPLDKINPGLDAQPQDDMVIKVTRVKEVTVEEDEAIPFESFVRPSAEIELDHTGYQEGESGVLRHQYNVTYENGLPVSKVETKQWVAKEPVPEISFYGTKIVLRDLDTPNGVVKYWRKIEVLATYYHNSTCGKSPDDPYYGITRAGTQTHKGVIAVDPNVIPLWAKVYVPGLGVASAEDTGGGIKGRHIDVYMPEGDSSWGVRYVTVYLLTPVPNSYPARLP